jgi:hypothetical protein
MSHIMLRKCIRFCNRLVKVQLRTSIFSLFKPLYFVSKYVDASLFIKTMN